MTALRNEGDSLVDNNIFENGWNSINAYIFGWVLSDGSLCREGRNKTAWGVRISSNDYEIMDWMHKILCVGNKLYHYKKNYMIKYRNPDGIRFMMDNNLTERKSLTVQYPINLPYELSRDFIRGYFDGNGSIITTTNRYNTYAQVSFTSGSPNFLVSMRNILYSFDIFSQIYKDGRDGKNAYYLRITSRIELKKFFKFIYYDINQPMLNRKYEKYYHFLTDTKLKYAV